MKETPMYRKISVLVIGLGLAACDKPQSTAPPSEGREEIRVTVSAQGYQPAEARAPANKPVRLIFTRTTDEGCGHQLSFPSLNIRRDLPLNEPVAVDVTMPASGSLAFTCGMNMLRGSIVVQ